MGAIRLIVESSVQGLVVKNRLLKKAIQQGRRECGD